VLLLSAELHEAPRWAAALAGHAPESSAWVWAPLLSPALAWATYVVALVALVAGTLGLATRWAWGIAVVALFLVLGLPQRVGASSHYHHLWWLAVILASSRCGDALSVDAWLRARSHKAAHQAHPTHYGLMLRSMWLVLGLVYLFPGLAKPLAGGIDWFAADNLTHQLWAKWAQDPTFAPLFRIDELPTLLSVGGAAVVVFEIGFVVAVFAGSRWRLGALVVGAGFHAFTALFMNIQFSSLWFCYALFLPWSRWFFDAEPPAAESDALPHPMSAPQTVVLGGLLMGIVATGVTRQTDGWPFACYPTFHKRAPTTLPGLQVVVESPDGRRSTLPVNWFGGRADANRIWVWSWRLAQGRAPKSEYERFLTFSLTQSQTAWQRAELRRVRVSTRPDQRGRVMGRPSAAIVTVRR